MFPRFHPRARAAEQAALIAQRQGGFHPLQTGKVSGFLSLDASTPSGGKWSSVVDTLNPGSPLAQADTDRQPTPGASANGLLTMAFDATDVMLWPQSPAHSTTTKLGLWIWYRPATVVGTQILYAVQAGVAGSATSRLALYQTNNKLNVDVWKTAAIGRQFVTTAAALTAATWHAIYMQYDSSRGGDANVALFVGGVSKALTASGFGGGLSTDLGALQAATGSATVGAATDSDTPASAIANGGMIGPNVGIVFNDNLTAGEIADMMTFRVPS